LLGLLECLARVAVFVEVFGKATFRAREADEVIDFVRLRLAEEILFLGGIALEAQALGDLVAFARVADEHRERARVHPFSLVAADVSPLKSSHRDRHPFK